MHRRRLSAALLTLLVMGGSLASGPALGQASAQEGVTLTLDPLGGGTVTGLAVLTPRDGDTAANVLAVGAPAGAMAVIHAGTCAAIDPTPVGLLGDVGTSGQIAATVPVSFTAIADGGHVLAFHPGLDLATTLACGAIPKAVASVASTPGTSSAPDATAYRSPTYGFVIDWDAPWQPLDFEPGEGYEGLVLSNCTSQVTIVATAMDPADATRCIRDWEGRLLELLRAGTVSELQPIVDDQGQPVGGGDAQRASGAYRFLYKTPASPAGSVVVEEDDCRRIADAAVLEVTVDIPSDAQATERPLVEALVAGIETGTPTLAPTLAPTAPAPPTPAPAATPANTPAPTSDVACAGMDAWATDTLARFDAIKTMGDDLTAKMSAGMAAYAQALADTALAIQRLQIEQQQAAVPESAKDAQASVIKLFQKLVEAYDLMAQAYASGNTGVLQQGLAAASEAQGLATSARTALRSVATPCGITVPAV